MRFLSIKNIILQKVGYLGGFPKVTPLKTNQNLKKQPT